LPHWGQNSASAERAWPHAGHATTGASLAGRPQFWQKCTPGTSGAPQAQRIGGTRRRVYSSNQSSSTKRLSISINSAQRSPRRSSRKRSCRYISSRSPPRSRSFSPRLATRTRRSRRSAPGGGRVDRELHARRCRKGDTAARAGARPGALPSALGRCRQGPLACFQSPLLLHTASGRRERSVPRSR
jgi:hypothetical protein